MKDLDFDELDRAVNSLMGDVSKAAPAPKPVDDEPTFTISPTLGANDTPDFSKLVQTVEKADASSSPTSAPMSDHSQPEPASDEPAAGTKETAAPAPANRRSGRFMDVVHPSSDMKKPGVPARPVSRQGVTVEPRQPIAADTQSSPSGAEEPAPQLSADTASSKSDWPDPLDMAGYEKEPESAGSSVEPAPADAAPAQDTNEEQSAPLTSPFLADAKVEKRPLGAASTAQTDPEEPDHTPVVDVMTSENVTDDDLSMQLPPEPKTEAPLPEELQNDLVAIESGDHMLATGMETEPATTATPSPSPAEETTVTPKPAVAPAEKPVASAPAATPTGPTSIAQQYKEEPRTNEPESGAIYDTQTYHQPLAHPEQKKSGWMLIVWIVLVVLVGVGAGAAVYFMGLM